MPKQKPLELIRSRLSHYDGLKITENNSQIIIHAEDTNGFDVSFFQNSAEYQVYFLGWHESFQDANAALNCFAFGLSSACRLKVEMRGNTEYRWTVQGEKSGAWHDDSTVGLLFFPLWLPKKVRFLQNAILKSIHEF